MNIDQELVKLFFTVANVAVPFVFNKLVGLLKAKSEYDAAIDVVSNLIKVNVKAAKDTIETGLMEASEDNKITDEEFCEIKNLVLENVKNSLSKSIVAILSKRLDNVDEYLESSVIAEMKAPQEDEIPIKNPDGTLNINSILEMYNYQ